MIPVALVMGITNSLFIIATQKVMGVSSSYYSFLLGVQSIGMVLGVIIGRYSASLSRRVLMIVSYLVSGISVALIGYTSNFYLALPLFFFVGFSWIAITLSSITLIQENVPREFLGRVLLLCAKTRLAFSKNSFFQF
jgi:DHA3 family macrolide efflux protein-like MFS transporter